MGDTKLNPPTLAEQYKTESQELRERIADAVSDFTARTGFIVEGIEPYYHDYRSSGEQPYYAVVVKIRL